MDKADSPDHVFWLGKIEDQRCGLRICTVNEYAITFTDFFEQIILPLKQIALCRLHAIHYRSVHKENVYIELADGPVLRSKKHVGKGYFLAAVNSFTRSTHRYYEETRLMVEVINAYLNEQPIAAHPNPYYREFERLNKLEYFVEEEWDAFVSPNEYSSRKLPRKLRQRFELDNQIAHQFMPLVGAMWLLAFFIIALFLGHWPVAVFIGVIIAAIILSVGIIHWQSRRLSPERLREIAELDRQKRQKTVSDS